MAITKQIKDQLVKIFFGNSTVPRGLFELNEYFRKRGFINFEEKKEDGLLIAISTNFQYGSIIAHGKNQEELDKNIKDAILTSFEIPSSYVKEANIIKKGTMQNAYALA